METNKLLTIFLLTLAMLLAGNFAYAAEDDDLQDDDLQDDLDNAADLYNKNQSDENYKVVCTREAPVGSRIKKTVCRTVLTIGRSQREARRSLDRVRGGVGNQP